MNETSPANSKVSVMLAGPGHEAVFYQMQPPFLSDPRLVIAAHATQWSAFETALTQMRPDLVVVAADIAPGPDALLQALAPMQVWRGVAIVILPSATRELRGTFEQAAMVRSVYIAPVNWAEVAQSGYAAVMTERARTAAAMPLQEAYFGRAAGAVLGTRVIAFLSASGGTGRSTIAGNLAYELAVRRHVQTLLMSFDLPPAAAPHLRLRYVPSASEFFARPGDGFAAALQNREGLDILLAPENSLEYQKAAEYSTTHRLDPNSIYSLVMASWTRNYAAVVLDLPSGEQPWSLQGVLAANTAILVSRCTLSDLAATRHTVSLLLERLAGEHRIPREAIFLVLNQVSDRAMLTPREFHSELVSSYGWAPPVAAVIPFNISIAQAQDEQVPAVTRVDDLAREIRKLADFLFPIGFTPENGHGAKNHRSALRLPRIRLV
ncbi:MAG: hypothetical protein PHQ40_08685 [Anaerolineaceae bacterium]|nr:hypothetical protein [Anaerolineaceae bacterium]